MPPTDTVTQPSLALSQRSLDGFCQFITAELGIKMSDTKLPMLQSRLQRRLRVLGLPSLEAYKKHLFDSPKGREELVHFFDAVTTNKTDFFREPQHFDFLTSKALPALDRGHDTWMFRLWCCGCSSGEEPYTLAMVLSEFAATRPGFDFTIYCSDISTRVLEHAAQGIYDEDRIQPVPEALRKKYLLRSKDPARSVVRVAPGLRARLTFRRLNLMDADYRVQEKFEAIFFRNVMIYFDRPTQEAVVGKLSRNLVPGGFLFTGHSESLAGLEVPVTPVGTAVHRRTK